MNLQLVLYMKMQMLEYVGEDLLSLYQAFFYELLTSYNSYAMHLFLLIKMYKL